MPLIKIISGGQTGADQAALWAAEELGLKTGGMMPKGYRTDIGRDEALAIRFKLSCHISESYRVRTWYNVHDSDATMIFGRFNSPGCLLTQKYIAQLNKPSFLFSWPETSLLDYHSFRRWLEENEVTVLNVAGNRESKNPGIFAACKAFLLRNLKDLRS